jgi:hypothetical protein
MEQTKLCIECGESITNPICPACIIEQAIACLADKQMSGRLEEGEFDKINKRLAVIIKANYTDAGVGCISCGNSFAVCPHCTARYLKDILPRNLSYFLFHADYQVEWRRKSVGFSGVLLISAFNY